MATNVGKYVVEATLEPTYAWLIGGEISTDKLVNEWTIAPKAASVTADDKGKVFGAGDPELTATVAGLVPGE